VPDFTVINVKFPTLSSENVQRRRDSRGRLCSPILQGHRESNSNSPFTRPRVKRGLKEDCWLEDYIGLSEIPHASYLCPTILHFYFIGMTELQVIIQ
jgi:hypothetical protein